MKHIRIKNNIFKQSGVFRLFILLMLLLNVAYVSIEIYKSKISKPLLANTEITQLEFAKIEILSKYALVFETAFLILSIVGILLILISKYKPLLKSSIVIQLAFLLVLFTLNNVLAWIFDAPAGNLTQLLFGPFILVFGVLIYFIINTFRGFQVKKVLS